MEKVRDVCVHVALNSPGLLILRTEIMDEDDDDESATLDRGQGDKDDVVPLSTNSEADEKKNVDPDPPTNQPPKRKSKPQAKTSQAALSFQSESSAQPPSSPVPSL